MFNSRQYEWADVTLLLGGRIVVGARGIKYTIKQEKEAFYGKGNQPLSIQKGNISYEGEISLAQSEMEALRLAGGGSLLKLQLNAIVAYGNPANGDVMTTDELVGIQFTEEAKELKQGDKFMEVSLPFICLGINKKS